MNGKRRWLVVRAALIVLLGTEGCLEHSVKTTVSEDGSCERTIAVSADSGRAPDTRLPLPSDTSWNIHWEKREGKSDFFWTASKRFPSLSDLAGEQAKLDAPDKFRILIQADRSFRWFYSYFTYRETYHRFSPLDRIQPGEVMSKDEMRRFTYGEAGDTLKSKVEEWRNRNYVDFFLCALDTLLTAQISPPIPPARVRSAWSILTRTLVEGKDIEETLAGEVDAARKRDLFKDSSGALSALGVEAMRRIFVKALGTESARQLPLEESWDRAVSFVTQTSAQEAGGEFENVLILPGLFLDTNAGSVKGNTAVWSFKREQLELMDYEMYAESRVVNAWAFIVSGVVAVGFLILLLMPLFRARRRI